MVNSVSTSAMGAMNLLRANNSDSGSLFDSLSGTSGPASGDALFSALGGKKGPQSIDSVLHEQKVTNARQNIFANIAQRLDYIQQEKYTPSTDWEKVAGYAMKTGRPMVGFIDSSGQPQVQLQIDADLSKYNPQQLTKLLEAMEDVALLGHKIQANSTNEGWIKKLEGAPTDLALVANFVIEPQASTPNNWEQEGVLLINNNKPLKVVLDAKGDLKTVDQLYDPDTEKLSFTQQKKLRAAIESIPTTIRNLSGTTEWELTAQSYANAKTPYYLEIDPITNIITTKEVTAKNITPAFLKTPPYPNVGANSPLLEKVSDLVKAGKPYFLDIDTTGSVVAREATAQNMFKYNAPSNTQAASLGVGAIVSLFA